MLVEQMKASLKSARRVSVTTDCWSGRNSIDNFLGITVHYQDTATKERKCFKIGEFFYSRYIQEHYVLLLLYLACRQFNNRHSSENLAKKLLEVLDEYGIRAKTWMMVTDNAANMQKRNKFIVSSINEHVLMFVFQLGGSSMTMAQVTMKKKRMMIQWNSTMMSLRLYWLPLEAPKKLRKDLRRFL